MSAFGGDDVDTLALMFDKLQYIFRSYDAYIQAFTEIYSLYKQGELSEREYYNGMTDAVLKYSALEFLGLKSMFEIKKALNRMNKSSSGRTSVSGLASGNVMGQSGPQNSIASFISAKSLPGRDDMIQKLSGDEKPCTSCGKLSKITTKFCRDCGNKF
ncbi:MAG: hypothetical protein PXX83_09215 [Candidatus Nitrosotalea sp.]|nr:hypothetical protein [Candidatus Nitrosotalea sp.]